MHVGSQVKNRHGVRYSYPDYGASEILRDFADHRMTVARDDGLYRHLKFRGPGTSVYWFDIITWPGVLTIAGDCGTYVFSRIEDMFQFFRRGNGRSQINPGYWGEKLLATACHGGQGHKQYSELMGRVALASAMRSLRERGATNGAVRDLRDSAVLDEDAAALFRSVHDWSFDEAGSPRGGWSVHDFYEHRFDDWTLHFLWCLHAIVWGIKQYDRYRDSVATDTPLTL